ncbi:hypothetical protein EIP86_009720 [Pleurotus ostreatoroseus]|nr:hypothetical protein EIP86_009720 [Pleurotus ostreatoroseus]
MYNAADGANNAVSMPVPERKGSEVQEVNSKPISMPSPVHYGSTPHNNALGASHSHTMNFSMFLMTRRSYAGTVQLEFAAGATPADVVRAGPKRPSVLVSTSRLESYSLEVGLQ